MTATIDPRKVPGHALSVDVEDWNNQIVLRVCGQVFPPTDAVVRNTDAMLDLLAEFGVRGTFFVLGEVADRFPSLVKRIAREGHTLGVHGFHHHRLDEQSPREFGAAILRAKHMIEQAAGQPARGYRAVAFSLTRETSWAYEYVIDAGFLYSSSMRSLGFSMLRRWDVPLLPFDVSLSDGRKIVEIPPASLSVLGFRVPVAGGGYLRHFPLWFSVRLIRRFARAGQPAVVYLHPHELDASNQLRDLPDGTPSDARRKVKRITREQLRNRKHTEKKIRALLGSFEFRPLEEVFADLVFAPSEAEAGAQSR